MHHNDVARFHKALLHRQITVSISIYTVDRPSADLQLSVTRIRLITGDGAFLQARRHGEYLGGRTRLEAVADAKITPCLIPRHLFSEGHDLIIGIVGVNVGLRQRLRVLILSVVVVYGFLNAQLLHHIIGVLRAELPRIV